jgi:hypothetical protein
MDVTPAGTVHVPAPVAVRNMTVLVIETSAWKPPPSGGGENAALD